MRTPLCPRVSLGVVLLLGVAVSPVAAQTPPGSSSSVVVSGSWSLGLGYPDTLSLEGTLAVGCSTPMRVTARGASVRGIELGASAGLGAGAVRISWADYVAHDAGRAGWSVDALALRSWGVSWAPERDQWFVGGGASWRVSYFRVTAALARGVSGGRARVVPLLQGHLALPPW